MDWHIAVMLPPLIVWSGLVIYLAVIQIKVSQAIKEAERKLSGTMDSRDL